MALQLAREVAGDLEEEFAKDKWHEDEEVYARFPDVSRKLVQNVVQSGLICYVKWQQVPGQNSTELAWKWWCWIPEPYFMFMSAIPRLQEWLQWEANLSRKQLWWMEQFLAEYRAHQFYRINKLKCEAAAWCHMQRLSKQVFFQQLVDSCRESDGHDKRHNAPELSDRGRRSKAAAVSLGLILQ